MHTTWCWKFDHDQFTSSWITMMWELQRTHDMCLHFWFFFKATITQKHQNIMFLKNCLSIKSPLGYNSSGEFLWETYKLSNKKYECFFGGNQFFQLLLLIAKNPAGKKGKKKLVPLSRSISLFWHLSCISKDKKSFILVLLKRKSGIVLQMPIIAILVGGKIVMAW